MASSDSDRRPGRRRWYLGVGAALGAVVLILAVAMVMSSDGEEDAMAPPRFVEEAAGAGLAHAYDGEFEFFVGGGVAVFDCDGDRRPDLYLAGGTSPAAVYRNQSIRGGELRFARVLQEATDLTAVTGAYPIDIDGDGLIDLAVLRVGENALLRGLGDCRFERANERWRFDGGDAWTTAFSAKWEGATPLPTLAFGNYIVLEGTERVGCADNELFRPVEGGYAPPIPLSPGWCTLSILFSDWDRSGRLDLRITNDRQYYQGGEEQLWHVGPGDPPRLYTREEGWDKLQIFGMGIASHDVTGDGFPELFLTNMGDNKLQTLEDGAAQPRYGDIAFERGVTAHRPFVGDNTYPSTGWHAEFQDVNNDGFVDLYVTKGNVEAMPEFAAADPNNLLVGQPDGSFLEGAEAAGLLSLERSRGAAVVDFNLDGMLDIVEVVRRENVKLWRNVGRGDAAAPEPTGGWVAVDVEQPGPNRDAIGAWIEVAIGERTLRREVTIGGGHAGGQLGWIHFGLGDQDEARLRVQWPDGEVGPWLDVDAAEFFVVERGAVAARRWTVEEGAP